MTDALPTKNQDISASHSLLNSLHSGLTGSLNFQKFLEEMKDPLFLESAKVFAERQLQKTSKWLEELYNGEPFIQSTWTQIETFDAKLAFDALDKIKVELEDILSELYVRFSKDDRGLVEENLPYFVACLARLAFSRKEFFAEFQKFSMQFLNQSEDATKIPQSIINSTEEIHQIKNKIVYGEKLNREMLEGLTYNAYGLIPTLRVQLHETLILLNMYAGGLNFEHIGVSDVEASRWVTSQIAPHQAGYWRAYDIGAEEALAWLHGGVQDPALAVAWKNFLFSPMDTRIWMEIGAHPELASRWRDAGYMSKDAVEMIKKGVIEPPVRP